MSNRRQLTLGAFFVVVLGVLSYYTLFLTDVPWFKEAHELVVHFDAAGGLRPGDSVLVAGIRQGRVTTLAYDPQAVLQRRVTVTLTLDQDIELREGFRIEIEDSTLLGGKQVAIDPGPPEGAEVPGDETLFGRVTGSPLAQLGELVSDNRAAFTAMLEDLQAVASDLREGQGLFGRLASDAELADEVASGLRRFASFSDNAAAITDDVRGGRGVVGRLFTDEELAGKLQEIADRLAQITADVATFTRDLPEGKGTLPMLVNDEELAADVKAAVDTIRDVVERINAGEGNLGRLVVDDQAMQRIESIVTKIDEGQGDLGLLVNEREVYDKLSQIADDLTVASAALREGEGSLGQLLYSDELYGDLRRALELVIRSLEEYREAAPVTTFTSVLFGAF
jgi:phospholipid/cholesterol/gamma-HCH transport system substrate-binding protein